MKFNVKLKMLKPFKDLMLVLYNETPQLFAGGMITWSSAVLRCTVDVKDGNVTLK